MTNTIAISIITPCYNHGKYLLEAVHSIREYNWSVPIEHIIVNDGSIDEETIHVLEVIKQQGGIVIEQKNAGPSTARNTGIKASTGKYILPVDSDNTIIPTVFEMAYHIMESDSTISVVYTDAQYIGEKSGTWKVGELNKLRLLNRNQVDNCALIRRDDLIQLGGYDEGMPFKGNEDWELWLKMLFNDKKFYYLEEVGYNYRVLHNSLSNTESGPNHVVNKRYLVNKYQPYYATYAIQALEKVLQYEKKQKHIQENKLKSILKILLNKPVL
ncbi:glycosyltransferase [Pontibacter saemangeumensis]|uniref:Glycosyltransferase n=1 Tax=Pontibacter saemangeumensis TaxID=1084525 RepID=A0ABP8LC01_9BACT